MKKLISAPLFKRVTEAFSKFLPSSFLGKLPGAFSPRTLAACVLVIFGAGRLVLAQNQTSANPLRHQNFKPILRDSASMSTANGGAWIGEALSPESAPFLVEICSASCFARSAQNGLSPFRERIVASHSSRLVRIGNDRDAGYSDLSFVMDASGQIQGLEYLTTSPNGQASKKSYLPAQLQTAEGAVLEQQQGVKAIAVSASLNEQSGQGAMRFRYIANGLTGSYKYCDVGVARTGAGTTASWSMVSLATHQVITNAKIISWSMGITTLQGICP